MVKFRFYTLWLVIICIVAFVLQLIIPGFSDIFVLNNRALYNFEIWRFVTSIFLHGSISHILYNMFALLLFGYSLEKLIGEKKFLLVFLFSGIIANIISVFFYSSSLGASGAIMGIIGCLIIIRPMMMTLSFGLILPMFLAGIVYIAGDLLGVFGLYVDDVGHIAHLAGVAIGIILGILFRTNGTIKIKRKEKKIPLSENYMRDWEDKFIK